MPEATPAVAKKFEIPVLADQTVETVPEIVSRETAEGEPTLAQDTGDQAPPAKPEAKPEEVTPEQAAKRDGRRFERKLDKAYRQRAEAQAEADLFRKRLAELDKPKPPEGEPKLEQFDFDPEKYGVAREAWGKTQAGKEFEAKQRAEVGNRERQRLISGWEEKVERGLEKYDDFESVVGELQPNSPLVAAVMEAENGEDIAHYLGKNPKEATRIAALSPLSQIREIGKLEQKLLAEPVKPKVPSKAPAPITPLVGAAATVTDVPSESDDYPMWFKKRQKQVHSRKF